METLFIDRKGTQLSCNQQRLHISQTHKLEQDKNYASSIPLSHLRSLVISCDCELSSGMLRQLAKNDVSLICLNNRNANASFMSINESHKNVQRKINQYYLLSCNVLRIRLSVLIIKRKLSAQRYLLHTIIKQRKELSGPLLFISNQLNDVQKQLNQEQLDLNEIMGLEGFASKLYLSAYKQAFNPQYKFIKRTRRPPTDPVNALLSLSYTLLYYEAQRACHAHGLDPCLSILHSPSYGRASLACDLQEALRADIDKWVWQLLSTRQLRSDHFSQSDDGCMLTKAGRKVYYQALPEIMLVWRKKLREHTKFLVTIIDNSHTIHQV